MSANTPQDDFVEQVRSKSDILDVISSCVQLKKKGNRYWGCCPFHNEKTPSFSVVPDQGFFYCFGCHAGGNVFKFISLMENISYYDAIKLQAERHNIPIPTHRKSAQEQELEEQRKDLLQVQKKAGDFFHNCLTKTSLGQAGREYFASRNITDEIIQAFHLGFAPNLWDKLYTSFTNRGIPENLLIGSGLVTKKDSGKVYDRFRNRVIIPIADEYDRICGFGGRIINPNDNPKYLNSPETLIFNKRHLLFGLNQAKQPIKEQKYAIVVEGYMDAIALHSHGITNAVASLGTAFTTQQCRLLLRFSHNIYFCYDNDAAGQAATMRALAIASNSGANVNVIMIPDGKDPDEFLTHHSPEAFLELVQKALPLMEFQLQYVLKNTDVTALDGKLSAVSQLMPLLSNISNAVERNEYIIRVANVLGIDEGVIRADIQRYTPQNSTVTEFPGANSRRYTPTKSDANLQAARILIHNAWHNLSMLDYILPIIPIDQFPLKEHQSILQYLLNCQQENISCSDTSAAEVLSPEAYSELSHLLVENINDDLQIFEDCLLTLHRYVLNAQYEHHRLLADELQRKGDPNFIEELRRSQEIRTELDRL